MISVIIPYYNDIKNINRVLDQIPDSNNYEVILVNDASSELPKFEERKNIKIINHSTQKGPAAARNTGLKAADGNIFIFLDSDIIISKKNLDFIEDYFKEKTGPCFLTSYLSKDVGESFYSRYKNTYMNYQFSKHFGEVDFIYGALCASNIKEYWPEELMKTEDNLYGLLLSQKNIKISLLKELEVVHLKEYTFLELLKNDYLIAFYMSYSILLKIFSKTNKNKSVSHTNSNQLLGLISLFCFFCFLPISPVKSIFFLVAWYYFNHNYIRYCQKSIPNQNIKILNTAFFSQLSHGVGAFFGLIYFGVLKKKKAPYGA
jgi:glycosyltransferase involved in cell wall biosynthesis